MLVLTRLANERILIADRFTVEVEGIQDRKVQLRIERHETGGEDTAYCGPGDSIYIADDIVVTVLSVKGNGARIGTDAPASVVVLREELARRIDSRHQAA